MTRNSPSLYQMSKCTVTHGRSNYIDVNQPPSKGQPWESIKRVDQINQVDLLFPDACYQAMRTKLQELEKPKYFLVDAKIEDIMEREFLNEHIKTGNISVISNGSQFSNNVFKINKGILSMHLDKETFERSGLEGKEDTRNGGRSLKSRWIITYDLTTDSMQHGKRGFDRLLYACKNVFNCTMQLLLCYKSHTQDKFEGFQASTAEALAVQPAVTSLGLTQQPSLDMGDEAESKKSKEDMEEYAIDIYEWISLARLQSPRIASNDNVDTYLSRYQVPSRSGPDIDMWKISWSGFIDPTWFRELLIGMMKGCPSQSWFSLTALGFERGLAQTGAETTIMRLPGAAGEFMMWEID